MKQLATAQLKRQQKGLPLKMSKMEKAKLVSFDQFLMPAELRKQRKKHREDRLYRLLDKSLQGIKLK